jgi:type I restriction-modification system DNA methylase subunit
MTRRWVPAGSLSSDRFIEEHAGEKQYNAAEQKQKISVYGQESNPTTWKLAAMNMAIRGIDFNFGTKTPIPCWTTSTRICAPTS